MPLKWIAQPVAPPTSPAPEVPNIVLAAPGSVTPQHRLAQVLAAGSLLALAARPPQAAGPLAPANSFLVTNLNPSGGGSLRQAIRDANVHPGPDIVNFQPGLVGTIPITTPLVITDSVQILGPGPGALSVSGSNTTRVFYLYSAAPVVFTTTISGLTIRDGFVDGNGGGLLDKGRPLILDSVHVLSNTANGFGDGGGIDIDNAGPGQGRLTLTNSIISGNHALNGGGIYTYKTTQALTIQNTQIVSNTADQSGGGVELYNATGSNLIEDSTIAGNTAQFGAGGYIDAGGNTTIRRTTISGNHSHYGGGLSLYDLTSPVLIENSTISGNDVTKVGGGVYVNDGANQPIAIRNSTIVSNSAQLHGGGIEDVASTSLPITDTIIAGNLAPLGRDISGTFQLKYDLVQVTGTATILGAGGNVFGLDPLLGPLALNGGPTQTHLPLHGSPAIDAGDPAFAPPPTTDQRGDPRVVHGRLDIGAVETALEQVKLFLPLVRR